MILKIVDYEIEKEDGEYQKVFWLYDNLERIKYKGRKDLDNKDPKDKYKLVVVNPFQSSGPTTAFEIIGAVDKDNREFLFAIETEAFIMNDRGETLEIIRC